MSDSERPSVRKIVGGTAGLKNAQGIYTKAVPPTPFVLSKFLFDKQLKLVEDPRPFKIAVCSRRCLAKGTLVMTTKGPKAIELIKPGEFVYDENGQPIEVLQTFSNGVKEVWDVQHNGLTQFKATQDHVFLVENVHDNIRREKPLKDFNCRDKIRRVEVVRQGGRKVKGAYSLGALLGDGCSLEPGPRLHISSQSGDIPNAIASELNGTAKKLHPNNYTWAVIDSQIPDFYSEWCKGRYAHEKMADLEEVLSWSRQDRLAFLAGLIDTDGSVEDLKDGLCIRFGMQAKSVVETAAMLFLDLWGYLPKIRLDDRPKYKNGPIHTFGVKHNYFAKKALKELDPYLRVSRKKWKPEYQDKLENNYRPDRVGVTVEEASMEPTYDINVASPKNLYLLANGMVTHNSGKTIACAAHLVEVARETPEVQCLYITLSRNSAKKLIWRELQKLNRNHGLGAVEDQTELSMTFPNGSIIYLSGAKDETEIEKFRGLSFKLVYIDECQSFRPYISELIDDVIAPALMDYNGTLVLIGTPAAIPAGYFAEVAGVVQSEIAKASAWSHHGWTFFDNPHIAIKSGKTHQEVLERELRRRGVEVSDPTIQREWFGKWVLDSESLWIRYRQEANHYDTLPPKEKMHYIMGIDLGFNDADAIAVLGYTDDSPTTYLVEELIAAKQDITALVGQIQGLLKKYPAEKLIIDAGALGKKIAEELRRRHGIPVEAADKVRKQENVALLNDSLRTGNFKAKSNSRFAQDSYLVEIDRSKSRPDKLVVSDKYHSDILDAALYAFKVSPAFYYVQPAPVTPKNTFQWAREEQERMFNEELEAMIAEQEREKELGITD